MLFCSITTSNFNNNNNLELLFTSDCRFYFEDYFLSVILNAKVYEHIQLIIYEYYVLTFEVFYSKLKIIRLIKRKYHKITHRNGFMQKGF